MNLLVTSHSLAPRAPYKAVIGEVGIKTRHHIPSNHFPDNTQATRTRAVQPTSRRRRIGSDRTEPLFLLHRGRLPADLHVLSAFARRHLMGWWCGRVASHAWRRRPGRIFMTAAVHVRCCVRGGARRTDGREWIADACASAFTERPPQTNRPYFRLID